MAVDTRTRTLNWACGLSSVAIFLLALPVVLLSAYFGMFAAYFQAWAALVFWIVFAVAPLALVLRFVRAYDRWQTRVGIQ